MKQFLCILFAVTKAPKKVGIVRAFDVRSDSLFPATDLKKRSETLALQRIVFILDICYPI